MKSNLNRAIQIISGEDILTVQDLMDHASVETTKICEKPGNKQKRRASKALPLQSQSFLNKLH